MSLINQALKKAQKRTSELAPSSTHSSAKESFDTHTPALHAPSRNKGRWYLIAILLIPALTLPILSSKWSQEKRHYREEIEVLSQTPTQPVAKHNFRTTAQGETEPINKAKQNTPETAPVIKQQGSRYATHRHENPDVSKFIGQSRISSIRAAGKNSKIVINNRTVPIDNYIDDDLPVRVSKISKDEIVFVDDDGHEYHKHF